MTRCRTRSAAETQALAEALGDLARPGDVVLLVGELGAGKTTFAQGFGSGLGVTDRITSPTFALHHQHHGRLRLEHIDAYRLGEIEEVLDLGLPELVDDGSMGERGSVVLIEWGDTISPALPPDYLEVRLAPGPGDDERSVQFTALGPGWSSRADALPAVLKAWLDEEESC